jgi:hypothetical protein
MAERGDMTVLHEPFCKLRDFGETDAGARTFDSPRSLLDWLREETRGISVFLKDHPPAAYLREVLADRRFLALTRHAFLIRRPEEIAASSYALGSGMNITAIGLVRQCEVQDAVRDVGGDASLVIDSDDLARFAAHHRPFYERLYAQRLDVTPWEQAESS